MTEAWELLNSMLGLDRDVSDLDVVRMALRALAIYVIALAIVRLGSKRFLSRATAFDVVVAIMLGSIIGRAINGSAPFFPTVAAACLLVGLHWAFAALSFHTDRFGALVKGSPVLLVRDGQIQWEGMRKAAVSERDLAESLRMQGMEPDVSSIRLAHLERNGRISIVAGKSEPRVLEVMVERDVQYIRIHFG